LVALLDEAVLPIQLVNGSETIKSDRISQGHRVLHPEPASPLAADYVTTKLRLLVEVDSNERKAKIKQKASQSTAQNFFRWSCSIQSC